MSYPKIFILVTIPFLALAQIEAEKNVDTDTIDIFSASIEKKANSKVAMIASIVLPGLGQEYLGKRQRAFFFYTMETTFLFGAVMCSWYSRRIFDEAKTYAWQYAGVEGGSGADAAYWRNVAHFMDSDGPGQSRTTGFNQIQRNNRTTDAAYFEQNLQWRWISDSLRQNYQLMLERAVNFGIASSFFVGAMFLNRLISFIDARAQSKYNNPVNVMIGFQPSIPESSVRIAAFFDY